MVNDDVPAEVEVKATVRHLCLNKADSHTNLRAKNFKNLLRESYPEESNSTPLKP